MSGTCLLPSKFHGDFHNLFDTSSVELLLDWRQSADEVFVKLRVGAGPLRLEEVDAAFTDTDCVVRLPGMSICFEPSSILESFDIPYLSSLLPLCCQVVGSGVVFSMLR